MSPVTSCRLMERALPPFFLSSTHLFSFSGTPLSPPPRPCPLSHFPPPPPISSMASSSPLSSISVLCPPQCRSVLIPLCMFEYQLEERRSREEGEERRERRGGGEECLCLRVTGYISYQSLQGENRPRNAVYGDFNKA